MTATAKVLEFPNPNRLECSACGALCDAACDCGVAYQPAGVRAEKAVAANPEKSDRAIADEIGVSPTTVGKARKQVFTDGQLEKRTGKDGKTYRPRRRLGHVQRHQIEVTEKIAAVIAANPEKTDHSIAELLAISPWPGTGHCLVSSKAVRNVRESIAHSPPATAVAAPSPAPKTLADWCAEITVVMTEAHATLPANERGEFIARMRRAIDKLEKDRPE